MSHVAILIIANPNLSYESEEFNFLSRKLGKLFNGPSKTMLLSGEMPSCLRSSVCDLLLADPNLNLDGESRVAILSHPYLFPAVGCIDRLDAALVAGINFADACDSGHHEPMPPPDFATVRGMERYVSRCSGLPTVSSSITPWPLLRLTTVNALKKLRNGDENIYGVRVPGAYVYDLGGYYQSARTELLPLIPSGVKKILDIGGGEGRFLAAAKELLGCETHLCEINVGVAERARARVDHVHIGDFLRLDMPRNFSCITFLDMLEHVTNPERYLRRARQLLEPEGVIIASIPNVGHWTVVADLVEGCWDYAPAGIHCITHLRFFTKKSIAELFADCGLVIERWESVRVPPPPWFDLSALASALAIDCESLSTLAWHCVARPG
jgi:SAM-dependent methyltransferase